jgi:two-component sensor histidine kinase
VEIPSETAIPLGLAIHELTANSAKFGALSVPEGGLSVSWQSTRRESSDLLTLSWVEHGGPRVSAPAREGFGTRMLGRVLQAQLGATVTSDFHPDGFRIQLQVPIKSAADAAA